GREALLGIACRAQRARGHAERRADHLHVLDTSRAHAAPAKLRFERDLVVDRQLAVDERLEQLLRGAAVEVRNHDRIPSSSSRSACRARVSRDFTVPTATPMLNAIS